MINTRLVHALAKVDRSAESFVQEFSRRKGFFTIDTDVDEEILLIRFEDLRKMVEAAQKIREDIAVKENTKEKEVDDSDLTGRGYDITVTPNEFSWDHGSE